MTIDDGRVHLKSTNSTMGVGRCWSLTLTLLALVWGRIFILCTAAATCTHTVVERDEEM